ncbi:hypothetical protein [Arthrobacter sp. H-02-3]|uniref:hypothetical protein n=1 Tax=Arthrobacter sp. H-02-3 TaxID=2703675 RepID=UPI000DD29170|nr:hypothetical protein [Arthrobacter sp. H-02-3]PVZ61232.1 hypothetical protein C9424_02320 [Arthrobacter sp. H-02-3]
MPAVYYDDPVSVHFLFPDGTEWIGRFEGTPNPELAQDLARGLALLAHPHGTIASKSSAENHAVSLRRMVEDTFKLGFRGPARDLTREIVIQHWLSRPHAHERNTRALLRGFDSIAGQLAPALRLHLGARQIHTRPSTVPYKAYSQPEWERLMDACEVIINRSWLAHKRLLHVAQREDDIDGPSGEYLEWLAAVHLLRTGPSTVFEVQEALRRKGRSVSGATIAAVRRALFNDIEIQLAYRLRLGMLTGVVPDGIDRLKVRDISWVSPHVANIKYVKGRTGPEGLTLSKNASRLLEQWLAHSEPLRRHASPSRTEDLWIVCGSKAHEDRISGPASFANHSGKITEKYEILDDQGMPLRLNRGRIRATYLTLMANRHWNGRSTIDPNHSAAVEGRHYLASIDDTYELMLTEIVEEAQTDMLRKGVPVNVLTDEELAHSGYDFADGLNAHMPSDSTVEQLLSGEQDVFLASCANQLASPFGVKGKACAARVWVCLLCPLAVFLPRHAGNLLELKAFFARQSRQLPIREFMSIYGPYAIRLDQEILPRFSPKVLELASLGVTDQDYALPLRPEEATR